MANNSTSEIAINGRLGSVGPRLGFAKLYAKNWKNGYETQHNDYSESLG